MTASFDAAVAAFAPRLPLAVAYSGGADSTALLAACAARWPHEVVAVHVNHGLQSAAGDFERHCREACATLHVPLHVERIDARHAAGESPEDAARRGRYAAVHRVAVRERISSVALAQHADDQVETLLLALSRGAGVAGLAGMRAEWDREGIEYRRPLLDVRAADIRSWLRAQGIAWIEDPTNASEDYTRNRIRARLLPSLYETFPTAVDTFARSARHAAQAQELLDELAAQDLHLTGLPPAIATLQSLGTARQANVLRHWLRTAHTQQPNTAQLDELLRQVAACTTRGHDIQMRVAQGFVRREGERLAFTPSV